MMKIYDFMMESVQGCFEPVRVLKESPRSVITLLRHKKTGQRFVFRQFTGSGSVYRRLLEVRCRNLPRILEVSEQEGQVAVLEEYVWGDTLYELLKGGLLSPSEAGGVMKDLCAALWVLHGLGAVHRDIKPENVILRDGGAVLIDFDAARMFRAEQDHDTRILGTTGFAPPEQYGISQTDGRADIYALGVLFNVMLTGKHPSVCLANGRCGRIIQRCTMTNPDRRYQTALQLMEALS